MENKKEKEKYEAAKKSEKTEQGTPDKKKEVNRRIRAISIEPVTKSSEASSRASAKTLN